MKLLPTYKIDLGGLADAAFVIGSLAVSTFALGVLRVPAHPASTNKLAKAATFKIDFIMLLFLFVFNKLLIVIEF